MGTPLYRVNLLEGVMLPAERIGVSGPAHDVVCVANKLQRHAYGLELTKVDGMPCVAIKHVDSNLEIHVPMSNVKSFELLSKQHEEVLTDPKRNNRPIGLVSKLG